MINMNHQDILNHIFSMPTSAEETMAKITHENIETRMSAIRFLLEICTVSKSLISEAKNEFFSKLLSFNLLDSLAEFLLMEENDKSKEKIATSAKIEPMFQLKSKALDGIETHGASRLERIQVWSAEILTEIFLILPRNN